MLLGVGTAADVTSTVAKEVDVAAFDGSFEDASSQAFETVVNAGAGKLVGKIAGSFVRTDVAGRFFNPATGRFVTNRFGHTVTAASDATRVSVSLGVSQLLDDN